jgi:hypothetical protein
VVYGDNKWDQIFEIRATPRANLIAHNNGEVRHRVTQLVVGEGEEKA